MIRSVAVMTIAANCWGALLQAAVAVNAAQPVTNSPTSSGVSAENLPQRLSLVQAQQIAFQRNWDLLAARSGIDFATAQLLVSKEFPNPTLSWTTFKIDPRGNGTPLGNSIWDRSYD